MLTSAELYGAARGRWYTILAEIIGKEFLTGSHGPCPICGGTDRFRWDDKDGEGGYFCSGCGPGRGMTLVMKAQNIEFSEAAKQVTEILGLNNKLKQQQVNPRVRLKRIMKDVTKTVKGDPVAEYLENRGLSVIPPVLMTHKALSYWEKDGEGKMHVAGVYPAMISMYRGADGTALTVQVQYIKDGQKAPVKDSRKVCSPVGPMPGGAVRLWPHEGTLVVAEGVETAIAAYERLNLPSWATLSADMMAKFKWPEDVKELIIVGDNDINYTGQAAAYKLGHRAQMAGIPTRVILPQERGTDYLDEWRELNGN